MKVRVEWAWLSGMVADTISKEQDAGTRARLTNRFAKRFREQFGQAFNEDAFRNEILTRTGGCNDV